MTLQFGRDCFSEDLLTARPHYDVNEAMQFTNMLSFNHNNKAATTSSPPSLSSNAWAPSLLTQTTSNVSIGYLSY